MRRLPKNISLLAVSLVMLSGLAVQPVFAEDGGVRSISSDSSTSLSSDSNSAPDSITSTSGTTTNTETRTGGGKGVGGLGIKSGDGSGNQIDGSSSNEPTGDSLRAAAARLLQSERQNKKASTEEQRQKACDAHQAELTTRQANYARNASKHLDTFNSIYDKVLAFQTRKQLAVSNFSDLQTQADAAKSTAADAVNLLSGTSVKIDCTSADPAASVANLKTAVAGARNALQAYRTAIKNMVVALQQALGSKDDSSATPAPAPGTENAQ